MSRERHVDEFIRLKLEDLQPEIVSFSERLEGSLQYVYFRREWFFEGSKGDERRTGCVIFTKNLENKCFRFACVDHWNTLNKAMSLKRTTIFDEVWSCQEFEYILDLITGYGGLEILTPRHNQVTSQIHDLIGIKIDDQRSNWYALPGGVPLNEQHDKYILPLFLGDMGLGSYLGSRDSKQ